MRRRWRRAAILRRSAVTLLVLGQTAVATYFLLAVLPYHGSTAAEKAIAALFAVLFGWVSAGFWIAAAGFVVRLAGGDRFSLLHRHGPDERAAAPLGRTAVVMPVYNEPVDETFGGLRAVYRSLEATGLLESFDFFVLSDTRDPAIWLAEQEAWYQLCGELGAAGRLFYRRRVVNLHHKSGNIADFLRRWGRDYDYMVVLDADSLMSGSTIVEMVRLMALEPRVGILQTSPFLVGAETLFARTQQLANRAYSPLFASGLAAMLLGEAAYWGHNAVIRVEAFMRCCGLRPLGGIGLFGGPILSHDFVEAAYMGRAGYEVWLEPELEGSYEGSPPTLLDELARDRRWARGNLQHLWVLLTERGLRFAHRITFVNGILSYLASPLWLAFLVLTAFEVTRFTLWPINYFPAGPRLFPLWPEWHPHLAVRLAGSTAAILILPKLLAAVAIVLRGARAEFGGAARLLASVLFEFVVSVVLAPIRMLFQSRFVLEALLGVSPKWAGQNRSAVTSWDVELRRHAPGMALGAAWAGFAYWLDPLYFVWSLPVVLPLAVAAPVSVLLSRIAPGQALRRRGLLVVPEESHRPPAVVAAHRQGGAAPWPEPGAGAVVRGIVDPVANAVHVALGRRRPGGRELRCELARRCLEEGPDALTTRELSQLAQDGDALGWLHRQVWRSAAGSLWDGHLASIAAEREPEPTAARAAG